MKSLKKILYLCEASIEQREALQRAAALAASNQAELTVMRVLPAPAKRLASEVPSTEQLRNFLAEQNRIALEQLTRELRQNGKVKLKPVFGTLYLEGIRAVLREHYDLVVKPAENPDWLTRLFGSQDMHLLRKCPCPVWLMKTDSIRPCKNVVAAIDFDPDDTLSLLTPLNRKILHYAASMAVNDGAQLHIVHAWDAPDSGIVTMWADNPEKAEQSYLEREQARHVVAMEKLKQSLPQLLGEDTCNYVNPRCHLPEGDAVRLIPALAQQLKADLVVMGTVARTGIAGLLIGNTAEAILDQLQCAVLALKPEGFVTPVRLEDNN